MTDTAPVLAPPAPPDLLPLCADEACPHHLGCVAIVDADELAEVVAFVREFRPVIALAGALAEQARPLLDQAGPLLAQLGQAARGGFPALLGALAARRPPAHDLYGPV